jgi:hypothetical protein
MAAAESNRPSWLPPEVDLTVASPARIYDYLIGGKDNFSVDRQVGNEVLTRIPDAGPALRENRKFLQRAVRFMAEQGIDQFVDLGTGIPSAGPVHEIAQTINPDARIVYVDNDPIVLAHNRALLNSSNVISILHDVRSPEQILNDPELLDLIDFNRPVGVLFIAVLHFITEAEDPYGIVARFTERMVPGSYLALSHDSSDERDPAVVAAVEEIYEATAPLVFRDRAGIARFFDGLELAEPGLVHPPEWRPDAHVRPGEPGKEWLYAGVARKP